MKILLIFVMLIQLTGCWNYYELNNIAICTGMAIDKTDEGYEVTYLISNARKKEVSSKEGQAGVTAYSGVGETLVEATEDISLKIPMHPYHGHLIVIVMSEEIAKEGLNDVLDLLLRAPESRKNFYLILSKGEKAKSVLEILSPLESFPSNTISSDIKSIGEDSAIAYEITYNDFVSSLLEEGRHPVLNSINILGDVEEGSNEKSLENTIPKANIKLDTLGIFKNDKLLGWTTNDENDGINILNNKVNRIFIKTECDDNFITTSITNLAAKTDIKVDGDTVKVNVKIEGAASIMEASCKVDLEKNENIRNIEEKINEGIYNLTEQALNRIQKEYKSDIFGIGNSIYKRYPKEWDKLKDKWDEEVFPNIIIERNVDIEIVDKGSLEQTLKVEEHEK